MASWVDSALLSPAAVLAGTAPRVPLTRLGCRGPAAARLSSGSVSTANCGGRAALDRHHPGPQRRAALLDGVRGQQHGPAAGVRDPVQRRLVGDPVRRPADRPDAPRCRAGRTAAAGPRSAAVTASRPSPPRVSATRSASANGSASTQPPRAAATSASTQRAAASAPVPGTGAPPPAPTTWYPVRMATAVSTRSGSTARQVALRSGDPTGARAQRGDQAAEPALRGQRGGQLVVGEQGLLAGHGGQPPRRVRDRVEQGERRRGRRGRRRPLPAGAGLAASGGSESTGSSIRTAASRARAPSSGTPFTFTSSSYTPVAASARLESGRPRSSTASRTGSWPPGARSPASGTNCGCTASVPALPSSASRRAPSVPSGSPRCTRISSSLTGTPAGVGQRADHGEGLRTVRR